MFATRRELSLPSAPSPTAQTVADDRGAAFLAGSCAAEELDPSSSPQAGSRPASASVTSARQRGLTPASVSCDQGLVAGRGGACGHCRGGRLRRDETAQRDEQCKTEQGGAGHL